MADLCSFSLSDRVAADVRKDMHAGGFVLALVNAAEYRNAAARAGIDLLITDGDGREADAWVTDRSTDPDTGEMLSMQARERFDRAVSVTCLDRHDVGHSAVEAGLPLDDWSDGVEWLTVWLPTVGVDPAEAEYVADAICFGE